jgi:hypothetical protein
MSPDDVARTVRLRLAAELEGDRAALARLAASLEEVRTAPSGPDVNAMRPLAMAFVLERFYTAAESIFRRALQAIDGDVPAGPDSHQEILRAAAVEVAGLRTAILPPAAVPLFRELLAFRHYARHGYDVGPELPRVEELARIARQAHALLVPALDALIASLRASAGP